MDDLLSEKEQIEQMRTWWSEYGNYVIGGVVIGAAALFGWNHMQNSKLEAEVAASQLYDELANVVVDANVDEAEAIMGELSSDFGDSNYAAQAKFAMARLYMDQNRDQDAADVLNELIAGTGSDEFRQIAQIRLAKIYLYQDKANEVVDMLKDQESGAFAARTAEVLGDAYVMLGQYAEAREAYQSALAEAGGAATVDQQFVQLKLLDLPLDAFADSDDVVDEVIDEVVDDAASDAEDDDDEAAAEEAE